MSFIRITGECSPSFTCGPSHAMKIDLVRTRSFFREIEYFGAADWRPSQLEKKMKSQSKAQCSVEGISDQSISEKHKKSTRIDRMPFLLFTFYVVLDLIYTGFLRSHRDQLSSATCTGNEAHLLRHEHFSQRRAKVFDFPMIP